MIRTRFVGLPNLIADRQIAPELLQKDMNGPRLAEEIVALLGDRERLEQQRVDLNSVREKLGEAHASQRAAEIILELLSRS